MKHSIYKGKKLIRLQDVINAGVLPFCYRTAVRMHRRGELELINFGISEVRPRWYIDEKEIERFITERTIKHKNKIMKKYEKK